MCLTSGCFGRKGERIHTSANTWKKAGYNSKDAIEKMHGYMHYRFMSLCFNTEGYVFNLD